MNRDHSGIFDTVPMYCISESFVVHKGYSISSKGILSTVVDLMVIWIKFTHPVCRSPAPASRDSTWRDEWCQRWGSLSVFLDCLFISSLRFSLYFYKSIRWEVWHFQFPLTQIYYFHKSLLLFRVPASAILSESALPSIISFLLCVLQLTCDYIIIHATFFSLFLIFLNPVCP